MADWSGFVLAGGRSRRMGTDKAFLEFRGRSLLARSLDLLRALTTEVRIVGPGEKFAAYGPVIEDVYPGRGPLAGIHAALTASTTELNLILAVDLPLVTEALLRFLIEQAAACAATVTVPRIAGGYQPLCAVYRRAFAPRGAGRAGIRQQQDRRPVPNYHSARPGRIRAEPVCLPRRDV